MARHLGQLSYQQRTTFTSSIEYQLWKDIREYCKERRITTTQLLNDLLVKVLEDNKRITNE